MKCKVCGDKLDIQEYSDEKGLVECNHTCNRCGYTYEFSYGQYGMKIGNKEFNWGFKEMWDTDYIINMQKDIDKAIRRQRVKLKLRLI